MADETTAPDTTAPAAAAAAAGDDRAGIGDILGQIGSQPAPSVPGGAGGAAQPVTGGGGGGAPGPGAAAGGGGGGGAANPPAGAGGGGAPDVVPIDGGPTGDLLNPHPGAPGNAAGPAGSEPTAAAATAHDHGGKITEQKGEQELSLGGSPHHGHGGGQPGHGPAAHPVAAQADHAAAPPAVHAAPVAHAATPAPPPAVQPVAHHEHHEPRVLIDPDELRAYANSVAHTASEFRQVAMHLQGSMAAHPTEVEPQMQGARRALEALADELEADARELEMRSGILQELEHAPGVSDAAAVRAAFSTHLTPFDAGEEK